MTWLVSANGTFELLRQGKFNQAYQQLLSSPQVPIVHRAIAQSAKPTCARQYPSAAQTVQPLPPKGH
jgi:hypothetical protein